MGGGGGGEYRVTVFSREKGELRKVKERWLGGEREGRVQGKSLFKRERRAEESEGYVKEKERERGE